MQPQIDESRCLGDGQCTRVCPMGRLAREDDGVPTIRPDVPCLNCGHCAATCPAGALSVGQAEVEPLPPDWRLDPRRVSRFLKGRRSIRVFRKEALPAETIAAMIGVAQYAPSGHNSQPLAWTVISGEAGVHRIADATAQWMRKSLAEGSAMATALNMPWVLRGWDAGQDVICREAPHLVITHTPEGLPSGSHAGAIGMTYLELAAQPFGVGTCWAGFVFVGTGVSDDVHRALGLPEGQRCAGIVMAGRPAVSYLRIPSRNQPRIRWC